MGVKKHPGKENKNTALVFISEPLSTVYISTPVSKSDAPRAGKPITSWLRVVDDVRTFVMRLQTA